jgi:predicted transcriptional regulator
MESAFMDVVGFTNRNKVIEYFLMCKELDVAIAEIIEEYNMNKATTYNVIKELLSKKIIKETKKIGNTQLYKLNEKNRVSQDLINVFNTCLRRVCEEYGEKEKITIKPKKKKH